MSIYFASYDTTTGRISQAGLCQESTLAQQALGANDLAAETPYMVDESTEYIDPVNETVLSRPVLSLDKTAIVADDADAATITGLPDPCTVKIDDTEYEVTGGSLSITSSLPATYVIEISDQNAFPAQAFSGEVTAS